MKALELLNGDWRVDPSPRDGQEPKTVRVFVHSLNQMHDELKKHFSHYDSKEALDLERGVWAILEKALPRRR